MSEAGDLEVADARRRGRAARAALEPEDRERRSNLIADCLERLPELRSAHSVAGYAAAADEVELGSLMQHLHGRGVKLHLPVIEDDSTGGMAFVEWCRGDRLEPNRFGIGEPRGEAVALSALEVVMVPCVAVDDRGGRVGFGGGYYDRALQSLLDRPTGGAGNAATSARTPLLIGVAFEAQRVAPIAIRPWDVRLDMVVTESVVLNTRI